MSDYTLEQMEKAETTDRIISKIPKEQRTQAITMVNAFLLGFEAQAQAATTAANAVKTISEQEG